MRRPGATVKAICPSCAVGECRGCLGDPCRCECQELRARAAWKRKARMRRASGRRIGRPQLEIDGNEILDRRRRGLSIREIAAELACSRSFVARYLKWDRRSAKR